MSERARDDAQAADGAPLAEGVRALVGPGAREALLGQQGCVLWLTGLSGSGKSTLARALERRLTDAGRLCLVLDGDVLRQGLNRDLGFEPAARRENIRRVGELACLLADHGLTVLAAFVSPYAADRERARQRVGTHRFFEIHLTASVTQCAARDPKGLYARALAGDLPEFTGVSAPYEPPEAPALRLDTGSEPPGACVDALWDLLDAAGVLRPRTKTAAAPPEVAP